MFCQNCGHKREVNERFCARCGSHLENTRCGSSLERTGGIFNLPQSVKMLLLISAGLLLLVLLIVLITGMGSPHDSPESVAKAFMGATQRNDVDRIFSLYDPQELESVSDEDLKLMKENFKEAFKKLEIKNFYVLEVEEISGDRVNVHFQVEYSYKDGDEMVEEETQDYIRVIKRDEKWYVQGFL